MQLIDKESILAMTHLWEGERFPDGRPRVSDDILRRMKAISIEQAWGVLNGNNYKFQFAGDWMNLHPDRILVGRAVTCAFVPIRPDFNDAISAQGEKEGSVGGQNSWVIDTLVRDDVIVVDLFGKVKDGTFAGDNLGNSIYAKTGTGMVIDGGIRDLDGIYELPDFATFVRGVDPTGIANVTLTGINIPIRIAEATVLPGDVVLGRRGGVIFIPPHFAQQVVEQGEAVALRDRFGHQRLREGVYTPGEIDRKWSEESMQTLRNGGRIRSKNGRKERLVIADI
ncbi:4-hydroxy-4-methyl-2-oxoglutarate aldolase/4-carboxy-4-hydroxy-2-oxoadipate aldolase [Geodia barretti]|uniref:4-hydroxy-4-methyl-2-oxoglutarate aldolase/4-carboxy-4-hydroxy-2-oxoadipate aldolase n=1 Tax=Geodia barretti TaxID=519541 RepID=A0AA35TFG4_GEOBA|nr:4-hydroxy-4-methyl-2-oxoglutarate aldolase/4-carboxy-4-hydroxy-2-oxoadipate aldolase [Geodia barretti]